MNKNEKAVLCAKCRIKFNEVFAENMRKYRAKKKKEIKENLDLIIKDVDKIMKNKA